MREFTFSAAAMTVLAVLLASAPASADRNPGPLVQNGQCWHWSVNNAGNGGHYGYWETCPQKAAAVVAPRHHHRASR